MANPTLVSSVVVPTDFSAGAKFALMRALWLPLSPKAKVTVLHVLPQDIPGRLRKEALSDASTRLKQLLQDMQPLMAARGIKPGQVVFDVVEGDSVQQIMKRAHTVEADVICMGRHGRNSLMGLKVGSTAVKVVKHGDVPVLLVRADAHGAYQRALVPVDLTFASRGVLKAARPYVVQAKHLEVLHASSVPFEDYVVMSGPRALEFRETAVKNAERDLNELVQKSNLKAEARVRSGDARMLILEEAKIHDPELIVLGTHGRKGLKRVILGSVAEWVMTHAECDVLVTRN